MLQHRRLDDENHGSAPITGLSCWTTEPSPLKRTVAIFVRRGILRDAGMKVDAGNGVNLFSYANHPHFSDRPACRGVFPQDARTCGGTPREGGDGCRRGTYRQGFCRHGYSRRRCEPRLQGGGAGPRRARFAGRGREEGGAARRTRPPGHRVAGRGDPLGLRGDPLAAAAHAAAAGARGGVAAGGRSGRDALCAGPLDLREHPRPAEGHPPEGPVRRGRRAQVRR